MIRHVVSWRLKGADEAAKAIAAAEVRAMLETLPAVIPEIKSFQIGDNVAYKDKNFDLVLIADYDSLEDLEAYQVHPVHQQAVAFIGERVEARANVDFVV